jgi:cytochrome b pre-mRNA-processing protein 3
MSVLARLLRPRPDPRESLRPLWHRIVATSRAERWYREGGVADSVAGRFDMIATILALVLLRLERAGAEAQAQVFLTELFVEDMDRQLRETGVGDVVVGKKLGKLVSVLGGRLGAYRDALADGAGEDALVAAVDRNVTLAEGREPAILAAILRDYDRQLEALPAETLLAADLPE